MLALLGCSAAAAFVLAAGLRALLPYESFDRHSPAEQFLFWEGVVWMIGLAMVFFGAAGSLGTMHLARWWLPTPEELIARHRNPVARQFSRAPLWFLPIGISLILVAVRARAQFPP